MSDTFAEVRLEDGLVIFATAGGPVIEDRIAVMEGGDELRNVKWNEPLTMWEFGDRKMTHEELHSIHGFWRARRGRRQGFRFKDWGDFEATKDLTQYKNSAQRGVLGTLTDQYLNGSGTATMYLFKLYQSVDPVYRRIWKPCDNGTVKIYEDDVELVGATIDFTNGQVTHPTTFNAGKVYTWAGEFDIGVRFDATKLRYRFDAAAVQKAGTPNQAAELGLKVFYVFPLPIIELRNPV